MKRQNKLQTLTSDLISTHLSQAFNLYYQCSRNNTQFTKRYYCISCIIHSVSAIEACISKIAYETFDNAKSSFYIPVEKRNISLSIIINTWFKMQTIDKINLFLQMFEKNRLDKILESKFKELDNLRNWLIHGPCYDTIYLLEPKGDNNFDLIDKKDSIHWECRYPNSKFNSLEDIDETDAYKALEISLEVLKQLSGLNIAVIGMLREKPFQTFTIVTKNTSIEYLLKENNNI
ncbi:MULTISPECIES: hypothetical protein [Clostridium]|uniref:Uncharacterized protein n=1 Tax=Clostridium sporogenes TaxID=1509 RepID=A0A1J1CRT5_CLOSG|nr:MULTISPECIES: hypothetical protein [Clostridium]APF25230.1 hypothetical protein NPD7_3933 [Clostridium sporogenes]APH13905.1 hypothetical protein NPD5_4030 [Clostridium sporogenes]MBD5640129.1 hypothetical protein [Clostridium botulinum]MDI6919093.1 hypothetical protein [Clostridium botulinum]WMU99690.1 hypothetical protein QA656_18835 [Clostridium botulinum]